MELIDVVQRVVYVLRADIAPGQMSENIPKNVLLTDGCAESQSVYYNLLN